MQESPAEPRHDADGISLRRLTTTAEFDEAVALQDEIWGTDFTDRVPASILRVAQKVGGVTAAAFDERDAMLGFVFGLTGIRNGQLAHWSDMLAVREHARGRHLGERLKHYQRDLVRALGVQTMFWTFDPLVARNAHFNLNRLGAGIAEYVPNFYGANTGSILHGALPTDRFVAQWDLAASTGSDGHRPTPSRESDAIRTASVHDGHVRVLESFPDAPRVLVPIPSDIEPVLRSDPDAALEWRLAVRAAITHYLARGYQITGFHRASGGALPAYELSRSSSPRA